MQNRAQNIKTFLLCGFLIFTISACGFQLRGDYDLDNRLGKTRLQIPNPNTDFARKLERALERAGVQLVTTEEADSIIDVSKADFTRAVLSIGNDARVREFRLHLDVEFSVLDGQQTVITTATETIAETAETNTDSINTADNTTKTNETSKLTPATRLAKQVLKQQRDLRFDAGRVLATSRESEFLQEDMSKVLVSLFLQRLAQVEPIK